MSDLLLQQLGSACPTLSDAVEATLADAYADDPVAFADWMMGLDAPERILAGVRVLGRIASPATEPLLRYLAMARSAELRAEALRALARVPQRVQVNRISTAGASLGLPR